MCARGAGLGRACVLKTRGPRRLWSRSTSEAAGAVARPLSAPSAKPRRAARRAPGRRSSRARGPARGRRDHAGVRHRRGAKDLGLAAALGRVCRRVHDQHVELEPVLQLDEQLPPAAALHQEQQDQQQEQHHRGRRDGRRQAALAGHAPPGWQRRERSSFAMRRPWHQSPSCRSE